MNKAGKRFLCLSAGIGLITIMGFGMVVNVDAADSNSIDINRFEEIRPNVVEKKEKQASGRKTEKFEEFHPQVKELKESDLAVKPGVRPSPGHKGISAQPLPSVRAGPAAPPPPRLEAPPIAVPSRQGTLDSKGEKAIQAARQAPIPGKGLSADKDFKKTLDNLESRIEVLKERVIETKARLLNYSQKVAKGYAAGTQIGLRVRNHLGNDFQLEKLSFYLDGHLVYLKEFDVEEEVKTVTVYRGSILPGRHRIDVELILRADEGLFDFGYGARLKLESGEYYNANEGKVVQIDLVLFDRGGIFTSVEKRPGLRFEIEERDVF